MSEAKVRRVTGPARKASDGKLPMSSSPELLQFLAAPESEPVHGSAFHTHGIWTPGVILMRNMQFSSKALLICLMFLIPLIVLTRAFYISKTEAIEFSAKEKLGIEYNHEIFPVINLVQQLRREGQIAAATGGASANADAIKAKLQTSLAKLADVEKRLGSELGSTKAYSAALSASSLIDNAKDTTAKFQAHSTHIASLAGLMGMVTDSSNLTLDPDIDTYYLMDAAFFRIPDITENMGTLRDLGLSYLKAGSATPQEQQALSELISLAEFQLRNMREGLDKAYANNKELTNKVISTQTIADTAAFFALARKSVINTQVIAPEGYAAYLDAANKAMDAQHAMSERVMAELDGLIAKRVGAMHAELYWTAGLLMLTLILAAYLFYSFFLVTRGGLRLISKHLQEMAVGDLRTSPCKPWGSDEPAHVIVDLRKAYDSLHALIRAVRHSARALHGAAGEIASASMDLSGRTETAAASLEEQAASMEEIGATAGNTADRAKSAATYAADNAALAENGGKIIATVVDTMRDIHASSSKISDIIGVINGIAFQTNILALNAAVEAARAGESGRGFAVVATEVRNLAHRSADAAREIKTLISDSVEKIASGSKIVESAGSTMSEVVSSAKQINSYLSEIAVASNEQALGVKQASRAIQELDEHTQQNAALVEQTTAASGALSQQAETLQHEIANFKVA
jgi:methyl-accepting chemotaxis protein